jgi:chromosome segregation ATPase
MDFEKMYNAILAQLKAEGFEAVEELVAAFQTVSAERDTAVKARDSFSEKLEESKKAAREKSGSIGALKQEIEDLKAQLQEAPKGEAVATPAVATKPAAEELAELEKNLTEEQWNVADKLLEAMSDDEAAKLKDPKEKLAFLKGLKGDPRLQKLERPKTLRPQAPKAPESGASAAESLYDQVAKRVKGVIPGPGSASGVRKTGGPADAGERPEPAWLKG